MIKKIQNKGLGYLTNVVIFLLGIIIVLLGIFLKGDKVDDVYSTILLSVGTSIIATSIVTYINSRYIIHNNMLKAIIEEWKLEGVYESKAVMNKKSNECLDACKEYVDIIAIGMENFLANKGKALEGLLKNGVRIRVITCDPSSESLERREIDELGRCTGKMQLDIENLQNWIKRQENERYDIHVKYYVSYPAFSYLRIDKNVFWSDNLCKMPSQQSMAFEFIKGGKGFDYYSEYFEKLWESDLCFGAEEPRENK